MIQLGVYFLTIFLLALGAFGFILAIRTDGKIRAFLGCVMALALMVLGGVVFTASKLKPQDFSRWIRIAKKEAGGFMQQLKSGEAMPKDLLNRLQ